MTKSLYEQLFPLTTVMKQRVVDNFDGDTINERWNTTDNLQTISMLDAVDGGLELAATANHNGVIHFNEIRHYDPTTAVLIAVMKYGDVASQRFSLALSNDHNPNAGLAHMVDITGITSLTNWRYGSTDGVFSSANSTISNDSNYHTWKIETSSANLKFFLDGVLDVTKTTNRPTNKCQPVLQAATPTASGRTTNIRYLEVYNT